MPSIEKGVVGMTFFRALVFSLCFAVLAAASAPAEEVLKIKPRSGVFLKMLVDAPAGARDIKAGLTGSKAAELMEFTGGSSGRGRECGSQTHHGFMEIEQKVVDAIVAWIKSH